jgi:hypothetical protein
MSKKKLKIQDQAFFHDASSSKYHEPKFIEWDRTSGPAPVMFFTDSCIPLSTHPIYDKSFKIAWLLEPYAINQKSYMDAVRLKDRIDMVLSHHEGFLSKMEDKGVFYPNGMSWVAEEDWKQEPPNKTANMSIIASDKNTTEGHQLRHQYISRLMTSSDPTLALTVDIFGKGYNPVEHKIEALRDYRFSVAIENCRMASYFTEKLIDCFAAHTVPVYWGCPTLKKFFNTDGIIAVDSLDELVKYTSIISENGKEIYSKRSVQTAIKENFELAKKYKVAEDWIYENVLKPRELV